MKLHLSQQDVYYKQITNPQSPLYNVGGYGIYKGKFDSVKFELILKGCSEIFDFHKIKFDFTDSEPAQYIVDTPIPLDIDTLDFSSIPEAQKVALDWMQNQFNIAFDLEQEKLYRIALIKVAEDEHYCFLCFHHLIIDGYGFAIFANYFISEYRKFLDGHNVLEEKYPSYAEAVRQNLDYWKSIQYSNDATYWKEKFKDIPDLIWTQKGQKNDNARSFLVPISTSDERLLQRLVEQTKTNVSQLTIAALLLYFGKTTGHKSFCFGLSNHKRRGRDDRKIVGMFSGILPFKGEFIPNQLLSDLISNVKQSQRNDFRHGLYPVSHLNRSLKLLSKDRLQLFDVLINYELLPFSDSVDSDLKIQVKELKSTSDLGIPLAIRWFDYGQEAPLELHIDYQETYFNDAEINLLVNRLLFILRQFESCLDKPINNISIIPEEEAHQLLEEFNTTTIDYPKDMTVVDLFESQAGKTPDTTAVVYDGHSLTYRELDEKSNQLAHYLLDQGVSAEDLVGICMNRSLEMITGILGILKSGAAYVPIDPDFPQSRIDYMLDDSGVRILLSDAANSAVFSSRESLAVIELDTDWEDNMGHYSVARLDRIASPDNLVYVIYTSGSTGMPKGVEIAHRSLTDYFYGLLSKTNISSCRSFGSTSSIATDLGNTILYPSLLTGGTLYVLSDDELIDADRISVLDIDCLKMVPSHWKSLQSNDTLLVPNKCLILGGEAFTDGIFSLLASNDVRCEVYNHYGPTETTIGKLIYQVDFTRELSRSIPLGVPFGTTGVYVLDSEDRLCPIGSAGELCIGGLGVARGYLNNDELTHEKFISNPFKAGDRLYKTGDLAKWLPDGNIEFLGRKDNQVKINGYRIELGEIENVLSGLPGVVQSCVLAKSDEHDDKRLIGYVVMDGDFDKETLQSQLHESLPEYMVPRLWLELDALPLTSNGKLDRKALPDIDSSALSTNAYVAPGTELEKSLAEIWQELLGIDKVGVHDNFFELGGQSLLSIRLIARIRKLGYTVNIGDFYNGPTIAQLSTKLTSTEEGYKIPENGIVRDCEYITPSMVPLVDLSQNELDTIMDHVPGGPSNIQDIYPLAPLQEGIYFHHLMSDATKGDPYVLSQLLSFSSLEKRSEFIEALRFVINRHDVLRTCILSEGFAQAVQVVQRTAELKVEELAIDERWDVLPQVEQEQTSGNLYMDLTQAPAIRVKAADDAVNGKYYLVLNHHHMVMDHVGTSKIIGEISLYLSGQSGLLPKASLYRDFIGHTLNKNKLDESNKYFSELFGKIESPTYPFNLVDTKIDGSTTIVSSQVMLSAELRDGIRKLSSDLQISPAVLFHAAFGLVLGRCSGTDYALFGSVLLGRLQGAKGSESSLGLFMNTLPVLLDLTGDIPSYISRTNKHLQKLLDHEQTPLSSVHHWSGIPNDVPMFSALLNYRHSEAGYLDKVSGFDGELLSGYYRTNYPFYLDVDDYSHDFGLSFNILPIGIDPSSLVFYMEEALTVLLTHMNTPSQTTVEELSILRQEETHQLVEVFNDTAVDYPNERTVVDLFEAQASKTPESIAVVYDGHSLTYRELDAKSNQLAHYLMDKGVSLEDLVGVCMNRSLEMIIGILGILKSGAAYVPIDPDYPQSRKEYMLEDSGVKILLIDNDSDQYKSNLDVILLDNNWDTLSKVSSGKIERTISPDNLAYVIYTSGSTGKPKGVQVEHKSIVSLSTTCDYISLTDQTVWLSTGSISFDATTIEYWGTLLNGGKLVLTTTDTLLNITLFKTLILENKITTLFMTTSWFHQVVEEDVSVFQSLKYLLVGGDTVLYKYTDKVKKLYPDLTVIIVYGPTENTTFSTSYLIEVTGHTLPIGKPIKDSYAYILDKHMNPAPIGVVGELVVGGSGVARGYLNNKELTNEKFVANPFKAGDRLYKTGDLAKWLPDGNIEFIGRKDDQVKIRGYRIELGEIENALSGLPGIVQSCVLASADEQGNKRLIAYVVMEGGLDKEALQSQLQETLPEYMVPRLWVELDEMPLTSNGKLDRKALPDIDSSAFSTKAYVAPRTETEERLAKIWQELLGIEKVGIHDNFFELGGHSLLATRLVSTIIKEFETEILIKDIFNFVNIGELATYIEHKKIKEKESSDVFYKKKITI
ncbi:non-ribosomal peptide synthetase [Chryseobacterium carnipullorum]|nr:non-ribosomal peptide synthetase [Chryseobacterium carnipullorum]